MAFLLCFLGATGYPRDNILLILTGWCGVLGVSQCISYVKKKRYFQEMSEILEGADKRYLLGELMPEPICLEDRLYREMIRLSNKSVIEEIRAVEKERKEYREFIESWVHEIKAPITSIALICENHRAENMTQISLLNQKIENYVEQALYYARADEVYKDYMIQETDLQRTVSEVLMRNKYLLLQNQVCAEADCCHKVYTDEKWIAFILNQLILNSVKYRRESGVCIKIGTEAYSGGIRLTVRDNGAGIREEELSRIFEKGFTGSNGRKQERSTGMGLYLCRILCEKLGISIRAHSVEGEGTEISLEFPVGEFYRILR